MKYNCTVYFKDGTVRQFDTDENIINTKDPQFKIIGLKSTDKSFHLFNMDIVKEIFFNPIE
jgi:hypothetical protein